MATYRKVEQDYSAAQSARHWLHLLGAPISSLGALYSLYEKMTSSGPASVFFGCLAVVFAIAFGYCLICLFKEKQRTEQLARDNKSLTNQRDHWKERSQRLNDRIRQRGRGR
jgi:ABC-type Co2+ transport system permease subunit